MPPATYDLEVKYGEDFERNFFIGQGARRRITAISRLDASNITLACAANNLANGDRIVLVNSDYYNGAYPVGDAAANSFSVQAVFEANETKVDWLHAFSLSGYSVEAKVWEAQDDAAPLISMTASIVSAPGGHIRISLTDTEVETLDVGNYLWDLHITDGSQIRTRLFEGRFVVTGRGT